MADEVNAGNAAAAQGSGAPPAGEPAGNGADASSTKQTEREIYLETEMKKAAQERDQARAKLREQETASAAEAGKFKELWEKHSPELESLRAFKADAEARTKAALAEAEKSIPAEQKSEYEKFIQKLPEGERLEWIRTRQTQQKPPSSSPGAGDRPAPGEKTIKAAALENLSPMERALFFQAGGTVSG